MCRGSNKTRLAELEAWPPPLIPLLYHRHDSAHAALSAIRATQVVRTEVVQQKNCDSLRRAVIPCV